MNPANGEGAVLIVEGGSDPGQSNIRTRQTCSYLHTAGIHNVADVLIVAAETLLFLRIVAGPVQMVRARSVT